MHSALLTLFAVFALHLAQPVLAQAPAGKTAVPAITQPLRLIVPNAPGGPTDTVARLVAQKLAERLGVAVVVDNRPGASGTVGGEIVARSAPDGRTLLLTSSSAFTSTPILLPNTAYDGRRDFAQVTAVVSVPYLLLVNPTLGPATLRDLIALAKTKPGTLNFGSSGHGSTSHLVAALFISATGINVVHVPYKGSAPAAIDIIGGQLQFQFEAVAGGMQYLKSGRLRALGISSTRRLATLPDLPTIAEAGVPGYEATVIHGICVTARTPPRLVMQLNRELVAAINAPDVRDRLAALGAEVLTSTPEEYQTATRAEVRRWEKVVREVAATAR